MIPCSTLPTLPSRNMLVDSFTQSIQFDVNSFSSELGRQAGLGLRYGDVPCAGSIGGIGSIGGVLTMVMGSDATVKGGLS